MKIESLTHALCAAAAAWPDREAVSCHGRTLLYRELLARARAVAAELSRRGVRRGDRVAIYMSKSTEAVAAIYGALAAGAAYVPLDPSAPIERLRTIVQGCGVRAVLADLARLPRACQIAHGVTGEVIDAGAPFDQGSPDLPDTGPGDLAYILYTSGSTGTPKGIVHTHASALAFAEWAAAEFGVNPADRLSNHAPFHFDLSTFDLYAAVIAGAAVVLAPETLTRFPAALTRWMASERITIWYSVPLALIQMLERGRLAETAPSSLRRVLFAGERYPTLQLRRLMSVLPPGIRYSNLYGPTETNVCSCFHLDAIPVSNDAIPIGTVCAGAEAMVADGELLIAGPTVMKGYWGRPDLNESCFVRREGKLFYRTGDLVSRDQDGRLHYIGRKDRQVKIRGYRVELDEIEGVLQNHPGVREAAVFVAGEADGGSRIHAAVTVRSGDWNEAALIGHAAASLPAYALPSRISVVEDLPRTSTGKVDRRELAESFGR